MRRIEDEFTNIPMTRQQRYILRKLRDGMCACCGQPAINKTFCEKHRKAHRSWIKRETLKASRIVINALASGRIKRGNCVVCGEIAEAHHEDYSKPLEITWLCHKHHLERHGRVQRLGRKIKIMDLHAHRLIYHKNYRKNVDAARMRK